MEDLLRHVAGLLEAIRRLWSIREKQLDECKCSLQWTKQPKTPPAAHTEGRGTNKPQEWKLARPRTYRKKKLPPKPEVPFQNCFTAMQNKEYKPVTSGETLELSEAAQSDPYGKTSATKQRQQMMVVGDSLLRSTEAPLC